MLRLLLLTTAILTSAGSVAPTDTPSCIGLAMPAAGPVVAGFAPVGRYAGHWGVDVAVPVGTTVTAAGPGRVSFAGTVAGNRTVTVDHGGGLKTSYSFLDAHLVSIGGHLTAGSPIGLSGSAHGETALHFSVRVDGAYVDPAGMLGCRAVGPGGAIWLASANEE